MDILFILIPLAIFLGLFFIGAFLWATWKGQYDDLETPSHRILFDDSAFKIKQDQGATKNE